MLVNPFTSVLNTIPGSRILAESMGLIGASFPDSDTKGRNWVITCLYAPINKRNLGGIRAKLEDQRGYVTFCNQRDLELLLGLASPGDLCPWTEKEYPEMSSREFYGMCVDDEDIKDDLLSFELTLRAAMAASPEYTNFIPYGYQTERRIHVSKGRDVRDLWMMLHDCDPETGLGPDPRLHTLMKRWVKVERDPLPWWRT